MDFRALGVAMGCLGWVRAFAAPLGSKISWGLRTMHPHRSKAGFERVESGFSPTAPHAQQAWF